MTGGYAVRLGGFVKRGYPPVPSLLLAVGWAYGVTGLFAALDTRASGWRPGWSTAIGALTLLIDLLLMRALDDIRDLDYDRRFSPKRPLAAGIVRIGDLVGLYCVGSVVLVALNVMRPWALAALLGQLVYAATVIAIYHRWRVPSADRLWLSLLVSLPAPVLLHLYLYAGYLDAAGHGADLRGALAVVVVVLAAGHLELAKKIVRSPRPGERTYVTTLGVTGTTVFALVVPVVSVGLVLVLAEGWSPLALIPLVLPVLAARRFLSVPEPRWPSGAPALYVLASFVSYLAIGLSA